MSKDNIYKSTIMFTDIVGYSSIVDKDQNHAMDLLAMHDKIIEPIIKENNGRIIKKIGDAIFAEFSNSLEGIQTAQTVQSELIKRNAVCNSKYKIVIRIGLHIGDVIRKDDDLFGHDVNLCSRIESIAPVGGIACSSDLISSLSDKKNVHHREMGYIKLKNITHPQQLHKIYLSKEEFELESSLQLQKEINDNGIDIIDMDIGPYGFYRNGGPHWGSIRLVAPVLDGLIHFPPDFVVPIRPMIGYISLASVGAHQIDTGGNMDFNAVQPGSTIHIRAQKAGGLMILGDVHAHMGDGELTGTGVEIDSTVTLRARRSGGFAGGDLVSADDGAGGGGGAILESAGQRDGPDGDDGDSGRRP